MARSSSPTRGAAQPETVKSVSLAPGALRELEEAVDWYEARDAGLGSALLIVHWSEVVE